MTPALREVAEHKIRTLTGREKTFCTVQAPPILLGSPPKMDVLGQYSTLAVFLQKCFTVPQKPMFFQSWRLVPQASKKIGLFGAVQHSLPENYEKCCAVPKKQFFCQSAVLTQKYQHNNIFQSAGRGRGA